MALAILVGRRRDIEPAEKLEDLSLSDLSSNHGLRTLLDADEAATIAPPAIRRRGAAHVGPPQSPQRTIPARR